MPKIDAMLRMMSEKKVERALLCGDKPYQILSEGRLVTGSVTPREQLNSLLEEIVPSPLLPGMRSGRSFQFQYPSPFGSYDMDVSSDQGVVQVKITPVQVRPTTAMPPPAVSPRPLQPAPLPHLPAPVAPPPPVPAPMPVELVSPVSPSYPPPQYPNAPPPSPGYPSNAYPPPAYPPAPGYSPAPNYPAPYPSPYYPQAMPKSERSRAVAGLLAFFLPGLGVHRFYTGHIGAGCAFLVLTFVFSWFTCGLTAYISFTWSIIEAFIIFCGGMKDAEGLPLS